MARRISGTGDQIIRAAPFLGEQAEAEQEEEEGDITICRC
jgi:hypothetical protein